MLTCSFAPHLFAVMLVNNRRAPGGKGFNLSVSFSCYIKLQKFESCSDMPRSRGNGQRPHLLPPTVRW